jgi:tRNA uridine 5-carbamoylmethylation protein Kti12
MSENIYRLYGINTAMHLLRPGAKWEVSNRMITRWDDPRPIPSWEEIDATMEKIRAFEDSINTIWLPKQLEEIAQQNKQLAEALGDS